MILDAIILENFGAYGSRQEAILSPVEGKPIILFGGLNGGGKTTLLDALQLGFYGPKARTSNRGRQGYKDYLRQCMHRGSDLSEGSSITIRFRRVMEGETRSFELRRSWCLGVKGIEEHVNVLRDGLRDDVFTDHWDEVIEAYLPSSIAHLFFFDGEQIKDLAEGQHAAEILGSAVHSLLGLDLVDRLEEDLKIFERRKRAEGLDEASLQRLNQIRGELAHVDQEIERVAMDMGQLVNEAGRLGRAVGEKEELFRSEGGELFIHRITLEKELSELRVRRAKIEQEFRELAAGPLPFSLIDGLLAEAEQQLRQERKIKQARTLVEALDERDQTILASLADNPSTAGMIDTVAQTLAADRQARQGVAQEKLILDAPDDLAPQFAHLRATVLPNAENTARTLDDQLSAINEKIARLEGDLDRVPDADRIALIQEELAAAREAHTLKLQEREALKIRFDALSKHRADLEGKLEKADESALSARIDDSDRQRMLVHSPKARATLDRFRTAIVQRHTAAMEALMLESFQKLLRKAGLITDLKINPSTFTTTLYGRNGQELPFDRLSAGERQLLATSMLWGLARASGRPVPTVIDTPLGRLDSKHRSNLIKRYFPNASHQVLLLSTDEEIAGEYFDELMPYVARTYRLEHDEDQGQTKIVEGYFKA